jgi:hypothetical protein
VLNEKGEIVAINYAAFQVNSMAPVKGSASLVTPPWTPTADDKWREAGKSKPDNDAAETDDWEKEPGHAER